MSSYQDGQTEVENFPAVQPISGTVTAVQQVFALRAEYDGNSLLIYFADAVSGSLTSDPVWRIRNLTYDGNGNFVALTWPNGSTASTFIWDNRDTYTYS